MALRLLRSLLIARILFGASSSQPCRIVEGLPWTMEKVPEAVDSYLGERRGSGELEAIFSGVMVGQTGSGKSTAIDILAGGHEYSKVGTQGGESETDDVCSYWFPYLAGRDASAPSEMWRLTDTPGFHDTKGPKQDIANQEAIARELRRLGQADAIVVVWSAMEKLTEDAMSTFGFVRSYFGPDAWRKMIMYYSFFSWTGLCFGAKCQCTPWTQLRDTHQAVMAKAFDYITGTLGTGDVRCNATTTTGCFPEASGIPYVGSDLYMEKYEEGKAAGCDLLDPNDSCYMGCSPNAAEELRKFRSVAQNLTQSPGYEPLNLSAISNTWVDCEKALAEIRAFKKSEAAYDMSNGTAYTRLCFVGDIQSQVNEIRDELLGNDAVQGSMAWDMEPKTYLHPRYGFDIVTAEDVAKYPDFATFRTCKQALDAPLSAAASETQQACWKGLSEASTEQAPKLQDAKDELHAVVRCRCDGAHYNCSLANENGACGSGTYCSLDGEWDLSSGGICKGNCASAQCPWPEFVVKRAVEQPRFCAGASCSDEECCTTTEAVCDAAQGNDTTGSCSVFNCWRWRGPTDCVHHECLCQHGYCERNGKCYSAENIRLCEAVEVHCGAAHSVRTTDNLGFGKNLCVCEDGYCSVNQGCHPIPELVEECKAQPERPQCSRIREVLGLGVTGVRTQVTAPRASNSASASFLDIFLSLPVIAFAAVGMISVIFISAKRLRDQQRPRGDALLLHAY